MKKEQLKKEELKQVTGGGGAVCNSPLDNGGAIYNLPDDPTAIYGEKKESELNIPDSDKKGRLIF